ncbi:MAG: M20 family metallopeptidase [candidate division Zixibacteria bacterium]
MKNPPKLFSDFQRDGLKITDSIIKLRRWLHQNPEIGHQEFNTTKKLKAEFKKLKLRIKDDYASTGLWAELDTGQKGPTVAVRTDIDALPIQERTNLPFASKKAGFSHVCGHDIHAAALIGTARLLVKHKRYLRGKIKFICQPAEEVPPGGARPLIKAGVLKNPKVDVILALHTDPTIPVGSIGLRDGVTMAATFDFNIRVIGKTGHAALPHKSLDAITVSAEIISGIQQVVSRMVDPIVPVAVTFGTIEGGTVRNGIAGEVLLKGTARSLSPAYAKKLPSLIKRTAVNIARAFGAKAQFIPLADYPLFASDKTVNNFIARSFKTVYPNGRIMEISQFLGGEDFACYLEKVPGSMIWLGVKNKKIGADKPWHHPAFIADERALSVGYITMASAVANILNNWKGSR